MSAQAYAPPPSGPPSQRQGSSEHRVRSANDGASGSSHSTARGSLRQAGHGSQLIEGSSKPRFPPLRAVTSEVWDDDFCLEPASSAPPLSPTSPNKPAIHTSRSHDRPFTRPSSSIHQPSIRSVSGPAMVPPQSPSRSSRDVNPAPASTSPWLLPPTRGVRSPSTDSFGSTIWGSDQDPTVTLPDPASPPRPQPTVSASSSARTARPSSPKAARAPQPTAPAMSRRVASSSSSQPAGTPELSQSRSRTPSLSSCGWSATAEEPELTEPEGPTPTSAAKSHEFPNGDAVELLDSSTEGPPSRWKMSNIFRRSNKPPALVNGLPSPPPTLGRSNSATWQAPRERLPHSSTDTSDSTVTNTSAESRSRSSIQFAPPPLRPGTSPYALAPDGGVLAPKMGRSRISLSDGSGWQQYEGATEEEEETQMSGNELDDTEASWTTPSRQDGMGSPSSIEYRPRVSSPSISFASSAQAFGLPHVTSPPPSSALSTFRPTSPTTAKPRTRKLSKRRPDKPSPNPPTPAAASPATPKALVSSTSASTLTSPSHPASPGSAPTRPSALTPGRQRSVTNPVGIGPPPQQRARLGAHANPGSVVEADDGWVGVVPFPPSGSSAPGPPPRSPVVPRRASASAAPTVAIEGAPVGRTRLFRRASSKQGTTPPVTAKTQAAAKEGRRPLSLSSLFSRSTSSLASPGGGQGPGEGRRAPSPSPSAQSMPAGKSVLMKGKGKSREGEKDVTILPLRTKRNSTAQSFSSIPPPSPVKPSTSSRALKLLHRSSTSTPLPPSPPPPPKAVFMQPPPPQPTAPLKPILTSRATSPTPLPTSPTSPPFSRTTRAPRPSFPPPRKDSHAAPQPPAPPPLPSLAAVLAANRLAPPRPVSVWSGFTESTEPTVSFGGSEAANADVTNVSSVHSLAGFANRQASLARRDSARRAALAGQQAVQGGGGSGSRSRKASLRKREGQGHRPSLSLSSIKLAPLGASFAAAGGANTVAPRLTPSPRPTLRSAMAGDRSSSYFDQTMDEVAGENKLTRRASLSDLPNGGGLKIPARILAAQGRIEGDLERVKQFAQGVQALKALRVRYAELLSAVTHSPKLSDDRRASVVSNTSTTAVAPSNDRPTADSHALATLDIDYRSWWEQAEALINLGDGTKEDDKINTQPPEQPTAPTPPTGSRDAQGNRKWNRSSSVISFETNESVQDRQREMLQGVILGAKGSTLPARAPPSPRPPLSAITPVPPAGEGGKPAPLGPARVPSDGPGSKRASRTGLSGLKEFLMRLKVRAAEAELDQEAEAERRSFTEPGRRRRESRSLTPTPTPTPTPSTSIGGAGWQARAGTPSGGAGGEDEEEEDWDRQLGLDRAPSLARTLSLARSGAGSDAKETLSARRKRTQSTRVGPAGGEGHAGGRMVLTTEAMPGLVRKVGEVRGRLEECVRRLEGLGQAEGTSVQG